MLSTLSGWGQASILMFEGRAENQNLKSDTVYIFQPLIRNYAVALHLNAAHFCMMVKLVPNFKYKKLDVLLCSQVSPLMFYTIFINLCVDLIRCFVRSCSKSVLGIQKAMT